MIFQAKDLLEKYQKTYNESITHPLTNDICSGTLSNEKLFVYLQQDLKFFESGLLVMGKALSVCDCSESIVTLAKQIGFFANDENDYFRKCLAVLSSQPLRVPESMVNGEEVLPDVEEYIDFMKGFVSGDITYLEIITFIFTMEQVYLGWAQYHLDRGLNVEKLPYKFSEWIRLHSDKEFIEWLKFLEREVERSVKSPSDAAKCEDIFRLTVEQEIKFFDGCYNYQNKDH